MGLHKTVNFMNAPEAIIEKFQLKDGEKCPLKQED